MAACERCSAPGACGACPVRRSRNELNVGSLNEVPSGFQGVITFKLVSRRSSEPPISKPVSNEKSTNKKICFICKQSSCDHSETLELAA